MASLSSGEPTAANLAAAARRLKKREQDRKAQRKARERKNNRVAHLEALVDQLSKDNAESEVPTLMARLSSVSKERDALVSALQTLESSIRHHIQQATENRSLPAPPPKESPESHVAASPASPDLAESSSVRWNDVSAHVFPDEAAWDLQSSVVPLDNPWDSIPYIPIDAQPPQDLPSTSLISRPRSESSHNSSTADEDVIVPLPATRCYCLPDPNHNHTVNTWRAANQALGKAPMPLTPETAAAEDATNHDTPVRVILEGWDALEAAGLLTDSWRKLRLVDEVCFKTCGDVERLAILKTMHLIMTCHGDPTPERLGQLPLWLWTRPSQTIAHSYAIDYFVWPGVRERFVFSQHRYCTNRFWQLFRDNFRISWQYSFRDCYMQDRLTGRYVLSPLYDRALSNLTAWTMDAPFFDAFPELCQDIPRTAGLGAPLVPARPEEGDEGWEEARQQNAAYIGWWG